MKAITTEEKIKVMQAFVDGYEIYYGNKSASSYLNFKIAKNPTWDWRRYYYIIKNGKIK